MCKLPNRESIRSKNDGIIAQRHFLDLESHGSGIVNRIQRHAEKKDGSIANFSTAWFISRRATPIIGMGFIEKADDDIKALNAESTERNRRYLKVPYKPKISPSESTPVLWFKHFTGCVCTFLNVLRHEHAVVLTCALLSVFTLGRSIFLAGSIQNYERFPLSLGNVYYC